MRRSFLIRVALFVGRRNGIDSSVELLDFLQQLFNSRVLEQDRFC